MTSSGEIQFNLDIDDIVQFAYEMAGGGDITSEEALLAIKATNLLLAEWSNKHVPLWKIENTVVSLASSITEVTLGPQYIGVLHAVARVSSSTDYGMSRLNLFEYDDISKKSTFSQFPTQYTVHRQRDQVVINLFPGPDNANVQLVLRTVRRLEDINRLAQTGDVPYRFLPAFVWGLAYYISFLRKPKTPEEQQMLLAKKQMLKGEYDRTLMEAFEDDRERGDLVISPQLNLP